MEERFLAIHFVREANGRSSYWLRFSDGKAKSDRGRSRRLIRILQPHQRQKGLDVELAPVRLHCVVIFNDSHMAIRTDLIARKADYTYIPGLAATLLP